MDIAAQGREAIFTDTLRAANPESTGHFAQDFQGAKHAAWSAVITTLVYKGFELRAGAFEVPTLGGYVSSLLIVRLVDLTGNSKLFTPRCPSASGLFDTEQDAIAAALAYGEKVVDGEVGDVTVADL